MPLGGRAPTAASHMGFTTLGGLIREVKVIMEGVRGVRGGGFGANGRLARCSGKGEGNGFGFTGLGVEGEGDGWTMLVGEEGGGGMQGGAEAMGGGKRRGGGGGGRGREGIHVKGTREDGMLRVMLLNALSLHRHG